MLCPSLHMPNKVKTWQYHVRSITLLLSSFMVISSSILMPKEKNFENQNLGEKNKRLGKETRSKVLTLVT